MIRQKATATQCEAIGGRPCRVDDGLLRHLAGAHKKHIAISPIVFSLSGEMHVNKKSQVLLLTPRWLFYFTRYAMFNQKSICVMCCSG